MLKWPNTHSIYYSQKELKHFGLEILAVFGTLGHFLKPCDLEMVQIYNKEYHQQLSYF